MAAWLTTILRNRFYSENRRRWREVEDGDGTHTATLMTLPNQVISVEHRELHAALASLPDEMREVVHLIASGLSYDEVAGICGCAVGTIKSRVHRARTRLARRLAIESPADLCEDPIPRSIMIAAERRRVHHAP